MKNKEKKTKNHRINKTIATNLEYLFDFVYFEKYICILKTLFNKKKIATRFRNDYLNFYSNKFFLNHT